MPSPVTPNDFKDLVPGPTGSFCEKFTKLFQLPRLMWLWVAFMFDNSGQITTAFKNMFCALQCTGSGDDDDDDDDNGTTTGLAKPSGVSASDGLYTDKIVITWNAVNTATQYLVYRSESNDSGTAVQIGTSTDTSYDDDTAESGVQYWYWVKASNATETSVFSNPDSGYIAQELATITDLRASQGFELGEARTRLVFTAPSGADTYDFWYNTADNFSTAIKFDADRQPFNIRDTLQFAPPGNTKNLFLDNGDHLVYIVSNIEAAHRYSKCYFWVTSKTTNSGQLLALSPTQSNSAVGWAIGNGLNVAPSTTGIIHSGDVSYSIPAGMTKAWVCLFGSGGGGSGAGTVDGSAGGGGGAVLVGWLACASPAKLRVVSTPEQSSTTRAVAQSDGEDGPETKLQYSADGTFTDTVDLLVAYGGGGGTWALGGGSTGGAGASGAAHILVQDAEVYDGYDGLGPWLKALEWKGGQSGAQFGKPRVPRNGLVPWSLYGSSHQGDGYIPGGPGAGSDPSPLDINLAKGGIGLTGYAIIACYAS